MLIGNYTAVSAIGDWGTERHLIVRDAAGHMIGHADPFWPAGIPVSAARRKAKIVACAERIIAEHEDTVWYGGDDGAEGAEDDRGD